MKTIGMVGVNTYHAQAFTQIFNGQDEHAPLLPDGRITHVWAGAHTDRLTELEGMFGEYDNVVASPEEMIGTVDGVLIIDDTDGGAAHAALAEPFLRAGIPTFIDKPMTTSLGDAIRLFDLAEEHHAPLLSGSALRFAVELADLDPAVIGKPSAIVSVGPGEWFYYGVHAVELALTISPARPVAVRRTHNEQKDVVIVEMTDDSILTIMTLRDAAYVFQASVFGSDGAATIAVEDALGFYSNEMKAVLEMIDTRKPATTREQTLDVLAVLHAGTISGEEQPRVEISEVLV